METTSSYSQWLDQWLSMQRNAVDMFASTWLPENPEEGQQHAAQLGQEWLNTLQQWWQNFQPPEDAEGEALWSKLAAQNQAFMRMAGLFQQILQKQTELGFNPEQWQQWLGGRFDELQDELNEQQAQTLEPLNDIARSWAGFWTRLLGIVTPMYLDNIRFLQSLDQTHLLDQFFPGLGYTRERQENIKQGVRLWSEYQQAYTEYHNAMAKLAVEALNDFRERLFERSAQGERIKSLREAYDMWVDCYEDAHENYVMTDEYSRLYGGLVNTGVAFRQHNQGMIDDLLRALNMPNSKSLETLTRRMQEMRRELREARHRTERIDSLETELSQLREQVAKLQSQGSSAAPKKSRARTTAKKRS